jgi:DEAD/DEAH box helicase domain-containing protein
MAAQQRSVVLPVRALDGRATSVRLPATASVRDLKVALRVCFPPAQAAPAFHLFLRGGQLLLDAKLAGPRNLFLPASSSWTPKFVQKKI